MNDELRKWCRDNWNKIDPLIRKDCLDHLEDWFAPSSKTFSIIYLRKYRDDPSFHFTVGMAIRNRLRDQLTDMELPAVTVDHVGQPYGPSHNWDDYYTGALDEFLERHEPCHSGK